MDREEKGSSIISIPESYVVVDIETTGLDFEYCSIIQISALKVVDSVIVDRYTSFVRLPDGEKLDSFITELTGITDDMLAAAPDIDIVIPEFYLFVSDSVIVGHNVNFDINFLYDACFRILGKPLKNNFIDTMRFSRKIFSGKSHHRLSDLSEYCGVDCTGAHRADADCMITFLCFDKMKDIISERYATFSEFEKSFVSVKNGLDVKSIVADNNDFDESHMLYKKSVVFTGALSNYTRKEAMQMVVNVGGLVADSVTKTTNYLVVGSLDFAKSVTDGKSSKMKKAEKMKLEGFDIDVISENAFFEMLNN